MTSTADVGDRIEITATQHAWYGHFGRVVTRNRNGVGVLLDTGPIPAVGIFVHDSQYEVVKLAQRLQDFYYTPPAVRVDSRYTLPFALPTSNILNSLVEEKVDQMTLNPDPLRKPFKEGNEIEHPAHYNMFPVEAIDVCEHLGFNLGNVVKYVMRADFKGSKIKDLKKALFYLEREIARAEDAPIPDVLDDWWCEADQSKLLRVIGERLEAGGHLADYSSLGINVHQPWRARVRKTSTVDEVINFDNAEKAEIITAFEARSK